MKSFMKNINQNIFFIWNILTFPLFRFYRRRNVYLVTADQSPFGLHEEGILIRNRVNYTIEY